MTTLCMWYAQVSAFTRATLLSITAKQLGETIEQHQYDAPVFMKAMQHADKLLNPEKRGRSSTASELLQTADVMADAKKPTRASISRGSVVGADGEAEAKADDMSNAACNGWLPAAAGAGKPKAAATSGGGSGGSAGAPMDAVRTACSA